MDTLRNYNKAANELYLQSLINPENYVAKIPSPLPISSTTAALRDNFSITPNNSGKFLLIIDPFYCKAQLYQSADVDGNGNGTVTEITIDQNNSIVDQYRLVSCSLILRYYGNFNEMSGIFVGALTSNVKAGQSGTGYTTYLTFQNIEDLPNKFISKAVDGMKLIYAPMDNRAVEFRDSTEFTNGTHPCRWQYLFVVYGDLFPNTTCIRCDFYRNIEYTCTPLYKEYILQQKSLPCNFTMPMISTIGEPAPVRNASSNLVDNNKSYEFKIYNRIRSLGENISLDKFLL